MMRGSPYTFKDRRDAGRQLAQAILRFRASAPLVVGLPRGGVPVAYEIARALDAPLELLMVRKIGAPGHKELGIGAIVDGDNPQILINEDTASRMALPRNYIEQEARRELEEIEIRRRKYLAGRPSQSVENRTAIVVDDGIATGGTVRIALQAIRRAGAARTILAVPVAPADTLATLKAEADEIVCLSTPEPFFAVGQHYLDFEQTPDEEVVRLMDEARKVTT